MINHATAEQVFAITTLGTESAPVAATDEPVRMRLWRRAVITAALVTSPAPAIATVTTGRAGWTTLVLLADIAALVGSVISHAHAEDAVQWQPEPVEIDYIDAAGNHIHYTVRTATPERA